MKRGRVISGMFRSRPLLLALPVAVTATLAFSASSFAAGWPQPHDVAGSDTNIFADMVVAPDGTTVAL